VNISFDQEEVGPCDQTGCNIREAITAANFSPGSDVIAFDLPGTPSAVMKPRRPLPRVTEPVTIDGTTQSGYDGSPLVALSAELIPWEQAGDGVGLYLAGGHSTLRGLSVYGFHTDIYVDDLDGATGGGDVIQSNFVGYKRNRHAGPGYDWQAIYVDAAGTTIGGPGEGNLLTSLGNPLFLKKPTTVQGNTVGFNEFAGIQVEGLGNVIGGTDPGEGNVIGPSWEYGIVIQPWGQAVIQGNLIGVSRSGERIENSFGGIGVWGDDNIIGGLEPGAGNVIANNRGGVYVAGEGNTVVGNSIYSNHSIGIDIGGTGVTSNDVGDGDTGGNSLQNKPSLTRIQNGPVSSRVDGTLNSTPNSVFHIDVFTSPACDSEGYGEGKHFQTRTDVTTDGSGDATFSVKTAKPVPQGSYVTATATNDAGETSEFSRCMSRDSVSASVACRWHPVLTPGKSQGRVTQLNGVSISPGGSVWAVGTHFGKNPFLPAAMRWTGDEWEIFAPPKTSARSTKLEDVAAISEDNAWAVGGSEPKPQKALVEHFDGQEWRIARTPDLGVRSDVLSAVDASSAGDVWAVGYKSDPKRWVDQVTLIEHFNGSKWKASGFSKAGDLKGVSARTQRDVWVVGTTTHGTGLTAHFNGVKWKKVRNPAKGTLEDVAITARGRAWAVGHSGDEFGSKGIILKWSAGAWHKVAGPDVGGKWRLLSVAAVSPDDVWATGSTGEPFDGDTLILHWDGTRWSEALSPSRGGYQDWDEIRSVDADQKGAFGVGTIEQNSSWMFAAQASCPN
jgi:hypothetical protein